MADEFANDERLRALYRTRRPRGGQGPHVDDETWVNLASGTVPGAERAAAFDHIVGCDDCTRIWRGVSALNEQARAAGMAPEEASRGYDRMIARPAWLSLAAGVVLIIGSVWLYQSRGNEPPPARTSPPPSDPSIGPPPPAAPAWLAAFTLAKADIHVLPEDALAMRRGAPQTGPSVDALAKALEPYRRDDYETAVQELSRLTAAHPSADRPNLYLGVSLLFLDRAAQAIRPLQVAKASTVPVIARDAQWYLAVAFARMGESDRALPEVEALCASGDVNAARACAARDALSQRFR